MEQLEARIAKMRDDLITEAHHETTSVATRASVQGALNSGRHLMLTNAAIKEVTSRRFREMASFLRRLDKFDAHGRNALLSSTMRSVRDELVDHHRRKSAAARAFGEQGILLQMTDKLGAEIDAEIAAIEFDFEHGVIDPEPAMSTTNNNVRFENSPISGSVLNITQSGAASPVAKDIAEGIERVLATPEVQALEGDEKADVTEMAKAALNELSSPAPDPSRVGGALRRLGKFVGDVSTSTAAKLTAELIVKSQNLV